jgi:hypothetical protein
MSTPNARTLLFRGIAPGALSRQKAQLSSLVAGTRSTVGRWFARSRQRRALREIAERNELHLPGTSASRSKKRCEKPASPSGGGSAPDLPDGHASSRPAPVSAVN